MKPTLSDTSREAAQIQTDLFRAMPPWRKLELVFELNETLRNLIVANASELSPEDRHRLLADRWLGRRLAAAAFGPHREKAEAPRE